MRFTGFEPRAGGAVISNQGTLVLSHVIMENNRAHYLENSDPNLNLGRGGAIYNSGVAGKLVIDTSTFRGNKADCDGGAIYNGQTASLIIKSSTFNGNIAQHLIYQGAPYFCPSSTRGGGAIADFGGDTNQKVRIYRSLFDSNIAMYGGATYHNGAPNAFPLIVNSTFTKNMALNQGGLNFGGAAIFVGTATTVQPTLINVTIAYNRVRNGTQEGALVATKVILISSFVATSGFVDASLNVVPGDSDNCVGSLTGINGGSNLDSDDTCGTIPVSATLNLNLDPDIAANGGVTKTLRLLPGSPAVNNGDQNQCNAKLYDQRGPNKLRSVNNCDIGAYEVQ
jgi:predicted outer membrane repeat protein